MVRIRRHSGTLITNRGLGKINMETFGIVAVCYLILVLLVSQLK
jgi:hypothetical protein